MSFLKGRLRRLEDAVNGGACPACGLPPDGPGYIVYYEGEELPEKADERCPRCGRRRWFVIHVVYDGTEGASEGEGAAVDWPM